MTVGAKYALKLLLLYAQTLILFYQVIVIFIQKTICNINASGIRVNLTLFNRIPCKQYPKANRFS